MNFTLKITRFLQTSERRMTVSLLNPIRIQIANQAITIAVFVYTSEDESSDFVCIDAIDDITYCDSTSMVDLSTARGNLVPFLLSHWTDGEKILSLR